MLPKGLREVHRQTCRCSAKTALDTAGRVKQMVRPRDKEEDALRRT